MRRGDARAERGFEDGEACARVVRGLGIASGTQQRLRQIDLAGGGFWMAVAEGTARARGCAIHQFHRFGRAYHRRQAIEKIAHLGGIGTVGRFGVRQGMAPGCGGAGLIAGSQAQIAERRESEDGERRV